ncbi:D-alanyl-D-alanine carboxypeptidase [Microbaculum marinum]|uniref:D-alanyl-D-alanine carboxypeptidase n=1 Tax=Microbaculum marinum TaxID=1764581 RepID=A0AAW9S0R3_9HYPH
MIGVLRQFRKNFSSSFGRLARGVALASVGIAVLAAPPAKAEDRYAAFVIDASNGNILFSRYADDKRYPASLTKILTLYLVFEDLDAGKIRLDTPLKASQNAANQAPSKIGIRPGETITVDQAIRALVTKSANDVAVVVAENLGGSVSNFAARMTQTARSIGMRGSNFRNPHGLPDSGQYTTAHDMATLAIQTMRRFPQYYGYFQTKSFTWKGATYGNHNKLLGRVAGVDGMKTGYISASGFNLVSSMRRDGRHIVGVVMGGRTGATRDAHMQDLLETYIKKAATSGAMMFANAPLPPSRPDQASLPVRTSAAQIIPVPKLVVPSIRVPGTLVTAGAAGKSLPLEAPSDTTGSVAPPAVAAAATPVPAQVVEQGDTNAAAPATVQNGDWVIQVGAFNNEQLAYATLQKARARAPGMLGSATAFTETTSKGGETLWRARFAGFDQNTAYTACAELKQHAFGCFPARN